MAQEFVFRFMTVRPGRPAQKPERTAQSFWVYEPEQPTALGQNLQRLQAANAPAAEVLRAVRSHQESQNQVRSLEGLPFPVEKALAWVAEHAKDKLEEIDLMKAVRELHGGSAAEIIASDAFKTTRARLADTLVAEAFRSTWEKPTDGLAAALKWMRVLEVLAGKGPKALGFEPDITVGRAFARLSLAIPDFARLPAQAPDRNPDPAPANPPGAGGSVAEREALTKKLKDLEGAHLEIARKVFDEDALVKPALPKMEAVSPLLDLELRVAAMEAGRTSPPRSSDPDREAKAANLPRARPVVLEGASLAQSAGAKVHLNPEAIARLSEPSKRVLAETGIDLKKVEPTLAVGMLEEEMRLTSARMASAETADTVLLLGGVMMSTKKVKESLLGRGPSLSDLLKDQCHFQAGIGDLLMVKQILKAYELAEFAHVENVLAGETREREHRRLNVREEILVSEEERETEKERNLQSTERNEMQSEAEKTVKSQFELEAGLQVSGSYGPAVSFSASLNAGFSTSTEETQRKAVSYSREVTEKTSERVRERVKKEVRRRMLEQVEERNLHTIANTPASNGHVRGIYRWLNKVYDAQILNYGQRLMFEFVVPEPAAYLLYALIENPPKDQELVKPEPPAHYGAPLKPSHLSRTNYLDFVAKYQVRNVPPPPPEFQHVSIFDKQDKVQDGSNFGRGTKVEIPSGYHAYGATVMAVKTHTEGQSNHFRVMVGGTDFDVSNYWGSTYKNLDNRYKELGIAYHLFRAWSFALAVDVHCRLTPEGFAKWQQAAFDAIMEAYLIQKADYEEKLAALAIQQGVKILGRNQLENRRLEREELKKLVLMMLTKKNDIAKDSMLPGAEPRIDLLKACVNGNYIRFFENAFEWNNLMYVLYPYFWGRKARWISALHFTDPDPDFAAFLKAGAARVQVPVRPGFEKAVAHFCQFGQVWEGNDPPLRDDELYVPLVEEIAENLGKLDEGMPYPEGAGPWEVRIPTSLVLVQNVEEIPGIKDILTGGTVSMTGPAAPGPTPVPAPPPAPGPGPAPVPPGPGPA